MPSLIVVSGANEGDYYPLGKRTIIVGRDEACAVQLLDDLVSRKHLQVRFDEGNENYLALDMKSANGVTVNGRSVSSDVVLIDGDMIELGQSKIMFTDSDFDDRESAMNHFKQRGQRDRSTLMR